MSIPLADKRTRDNLSMLANAITAGRTGDTSMRLKLNYSGVASITGSGVTTDYFSSDIPDFVQNKSLCTSIHDVTAQLNSEVNKSGYYLKNKLVADALGVTRLWMCRALTAPPAAGEASHAVGCRRPSVVKRNDKRLITVSSRNSVNQIRRS